MAVLIPLAVASWILFLKIPREVILDEGHLVFNGFIGTVRMDLDDIYSIDDVGGGRYTRFEALTTYVAVPAKVYQKADLYAKVQRARPDLDIPPVQRLAVLRGRISRLFGVILFCVLGLFIVTAHQCVRFRNTPGTFSACIAAAKNYYNMSLVYFEYSGNTEISSAGAPGWSPGDNVIVSGGPMIHHGNGKVSFKTPMIFRHRELPYAYQLLPNGDVEDISESVYFSGKKGRARKFIRSELPFVILVSLCVSLLYIYLDLPHRYGPSTAASVRKTAHRFHELSMAHGADVGAASVTSDGPPGFSPDPFISIRGGPMVVADEGTVSFDTPMTFSYPGSPIDYLLHPDGSAQPSKEALVDFAGEGDLQSVRELLSRGLHVNAVNRNFDTPLIAAARGGHPEVVRFLLEHGADVHALNDTGRTSHSLSTELGHSEIELMLIKAGAK